MSFDIKTIPVFERDFKKLAKKYPSLKADFAALIQSLKTEPQQGTSLGHSCFKIRLAIQSKGRGKSGRSRVITCVKIIEETVYLLAIYDKSERETISSAEVNELLDGLI